MRSWCSVLIMLSAMAPAGAQDLPGDPVAGREYAERTCADCHEVVPGLGQPQDSTAPPFLAVADDPAVTEMSFRAFLQTPHAGMPDIRVTHREASDLIAYILSLRGEELVP